MSFDTRLRSVVQMTIGWTILLAALLVAAVPSAQTPAPQTAPAASSASPKFEVAAIKPNKSGEPFMRIGVQPGGRFTATNVPVRDLIRSAYQVQPFQLVGGADWIGTERFDITAKAEGEITMAPPGTVGPMQWMLRSLLAERFKLVAHEEERELPIYSLIFARTDKKLGPKLQVSTIDCQGIINAARGGGPPAIPPPTASGRPTCGMRVGPGQIMAGGFPMSNLANALAPMVQRYVIDRTGLTGNYDMEVAFTPEQMPQGGGANAPNFDPNGPSIYTALQEQLGLKLDSQRGPVKVLVIDSVERPTED